MRLGIQAICDRGLLRDKNEDALSVNGVFLRDDAVELSVDIPEEGFFYQKTSYRGLDKVVPGSFADHLVRWYRDRD